MRITKEIKCYQQVTQVGQQLQQVQKSVMNDTYFGLQTDSIPWFSAAGEKSNAKEVAFGVEAEHNGSQSLPYPPMHREHNLK